MYMLSDFFIATPEEQAARDVAKSPVLTLPTVLGRGVDCEKFLWLNAILFGDFAHPQTKALIQEVMRGHLPHYPSDMPLWSVTAERLAGLCHEHRHQGAQQWASLEGWDAHGVTPEQAAKVFMDISGLAKQAVESSRGMYLWQCEYP